MAIAFKLETKGFKKVAREMDKLNRAGKSALTAAIFMESNRIAKDSKKRTPVDTGALRDSIYVKPPRVGQITAEIGYSATYAIFVHERTELRHRTGQAKFLQTAINASRRGFTRRVGRDTRRLLRRRKGIRSVPRVFPTRPPPFPSSRST